MSEIYLTLVPKVVPSNKIIVHNHVRPRRVLGDGGFRAWIADPDDEKYERCTCGWARHLSEHYRIKPREIDSQ
jgi:hypothetical protein